MREGAVVRWGEAPIGGAAPSFRAGLDITPPSLLSFSWLSDSFRAQWSRGLDEPVGMVQPAEDRPSSTVRGLRGAISRWPPKFDSSRPEGGDFSVAGVEESVVYEPEGAEGR